jgi:L-lactate dehydrogenase
MKLVQDVLEVELACGSLHNSGWEKLMMITSPQAIKITQEQPDTFGLLERSTSKGGFRELRIPRIAIVGTGFVGSTTAYALIMHGIAAEIVLINRDRRRAMGHANDLRDAELFSHKTSVLVGDLSDCCSADVTIITTGVSQSGQRSRITGLHESAAILHEVLSHICLQNPRGILLIASNPVDVLTYAAWKWSGLPAQRVIGSGTSLDTSRFRRRLAEQFGVASANVHAYVIGEHGDSQIPVLSSARIGGTPLEEFPDGRVSLRGQGPLQMIANQTRAAGGEIIAAKGATYYGIAAALGRIVRAILHDESAILTVSTRVPASMQLGDVSLSLPSIINRNGVSRVLSVALSKVERDALQASAEAIKRGIASLSRVFSI